MKTKRSDIYKSGHKNYNDLDTMRHSAAHLLAAAVMELYPETKLGIGPTTEEGFYYDFELPMKLSDAELPLIEKKMQELQKKDLAFTKHDVSIEEALAKAEQEQQSYKKELLLDLQKKGVSHVSLYETGEFWDVCKGPHVASTAVIGPFTLLSLSGAYWKGDEHNTMLTRIYGTAFDTQDALDAHLIQKEEAKKRDHRTIGKDLDLFVFADLVGKGLPLLTPKGTTIRRELERFIVDEELKRGYLHVMTPPLAKTDLFKTSGHYPYYKETMYPPMIVDEDELILRPMTCPHHFMLYKSKPRSYKELPLRFAELASLFRYEKSGELTGLMRVRNFCLADAHIICTKEDAKKEITAVLDLIDYVNATFGMQKGSDYRYRLSLGDRNDTKKYHKDDVLWDQAEAVLRDVLMETNKDTFYEAPGEAAFYGPKIDVQIKNVSGKEETAFTVQYDFVMPKRFKMRYIDADGKEKEPIVIHRSSVGAFERTMAFLIEHYAGAFPTWLAPVQVRILPITERHTTYAKHVFEDMQKAGIRVELDERNEKLQAKIRDAAQEKINYMCIIGDKEVEAHTCAVRKRGGHDMGSMSVSSCIDMIKQEITTRSLD